MSIQRCNNTEDFRRLAKRRLPAPLFHYIDGGADDEKTLRRNTSSFDEVRLIPNGLADLTGMDMSTEVLGAKIDWPVFCSPTGMTRLFHHDGERAVARAAHKLGTAYSLSTLSTVSIEEVGALTPGPKCFQIYIHKDRELTYEFVERCKAADFTSMCLTIDTLVAGNRERDLVTGMVMPPKLTLKSLFSFATHWDWSFNFLLREKFALANVATSGDKPTTTRVPFSAPASAPTATAAPQATGSGQPCCQSTPIVTEQSATIEPTDRSIPPVKIMAVMTIASVPISAH